MVDDIIISRLQKMDSSAISDALDALKLNGVVIGLKQLTVPQKIVGRVVTVKLVPQGPKKSERHLGTAAIEAASPGDVIVVEHCRDDVAGWGGNLSIAAQQKGISGVIIDGACRDIDEMRELGFPVYGRAAVPTTARGRIMEESFNEKITIGSVEVHPGDFVIADGSGVAFIPYAQVEKVLSMAESIMEKEALMASALRKGDPPSVVMGKNYETMLD